MRDCHKVILINDFYLMLQVRFTIGERLKQVLDLEASTLIEYKHHEVAMQDMSTFR